MATRTYASYAQASQQQLPRPVQPSQYRLNLHKRRRSHDARTNPRDVYGVPQPASFEWRAKMQRVADTSRGDEAMSRNNNRRQRDHLHPHPQRPDQRHQHQFQHQRPRRPDASHQPPATTIERGPPAIAAGGVSATIPTRHSARQAVSHSHPHPHPSSPSPIIAVSSSSFSSSAPTARPAVHNHHTPSSTSAAPPTTTITLSPPTPMPAMSYAAVVSPRRPTLVARTSSDKENVPTFSPTAQPVDEVDEKAIMASTITQTAPRPMGRPRSNSFYGRVQHTVVTSTRRSPPPSPAEPSSSLGSENRSSRPMATLLPRECGLRASAARMDLELSFGALVSGAVSAALGTYSASSAAAPKPYNAFAGASPLAVGITVSTTTTSVECTGPAPSALETLRALTAQPSLLRRAGATPPSSSPPPPSPLAVFSDHKRDSRCHLVAGLLLNRVRAKPIAAARARRRALWGCAEGFTRGEGGVFAASGLRSELIC